RPLSCFNYGRLIAVYPDDFRTRGQQGFSVSAPAQGAIQNVRGAYELTYDLFDHDRRMVGAVPPAGHGVRVTHLQKRFTSLSTAGVNCGIAVMSRAAWFGFFCPPAGRLIDARLNASRAVLARSQLRFSFAEIV